MQPTNRTQKRTIHSDVLKEILLETALCMLEIARDMRTGVIGPESLYMGSFHSKCGTAHCIAGWTESRTGKSRYELFPTLYTPAYNSAGGKLSSLFSGSHPNDPKEAADAIENYIFNHADHPWG